MCDLSRYSYAYLTWVAMWERFFQQRANIGITRSCMRWFVRKIESIIGVQWGQKNPDRRAHCSSGKRGLPSFPLNGGAEGGFYLSHIPIPVPGKDKKKTNSRTLAARRFATSL